ncbi:hypothetical protein SDC9_70842 [bioreactor metagenome]|uniref:Uncharacterized protein n=1 Tax=bioreactor metagenome TaxID=1076179 RepID=A0A644Y7C2_9ZZZZ
MLEFVKQFEIGIISENNKITNKGDCFMKNGTSFGLSVVVVIVTNRS